MTLSPALELGETCSLHERKTFCSVSTVCITGACGQPETENHVHQDFSTLGVSSPQFRAEAFCNKPVSVENISVHKQFCSFWLHLSLQAFDQFHFQTRFFVQRRLLLHAVPSEDSPECAKETLVELLNCLSSSSKTPVPLLSFHLCAHP